MTNSFYRWTSTLLGLVLIVTTGCAEKVGKGVQPSLGAPSPSVKGGSAVTEEISARTADPPRSITEAGPQTTDPSPGEPPPNALPEEPYDPFARADEGAGEEYDPWEPMNTSIFEFNRQVDRFVLKPVAKGYNFIMPDIVQVGISNMFYNLRFAPRFLNNVFQGKLKGAGIEVGRFLINSTAGIAGFFDLAKEIDLVTPEEDFGQTLGFYGVKPGPYLVLPLLPPFNVRDFTGFLGDIALNPINWLVAPIIEVDGVPSVIAHKNRMTSSLIQTGSRVGEIINERSRNLEKFQGVEEATLDLYSAVRNAYLQTRAKAIKE